MTRRDDPGNCRTDCSANQGIECHLALEQPGDLVVGRTDTVHDLYRRALRIECAPRRKHDRSSGGERNEHHESCGEKAERAECRQRRSERLSMGHQPRAGNCCSDRLDCCWRCARRKIDIDHRGQGQVASRLRSHPSFQRPAHLRFFNRPDSDHPFRPPKRCGEPGGRCSIAVDLYRVALVDTLRGNRRGLSKRETGSPDHDHDEHHDCNDERHRPFQPTAAEQSRFRRAGGKKRADHTPSLRCGGLRNTPVGSTTCP